MKRKEHYILLAIVLLYFVVYAIQIFWFENEIINFESDNLIYDAKLVAEGVVPFKELFTRSIVILYVYAGAIALFGVHVKFLQLLVAIASGAALYLFGWSAHKLFNNFTITALATIGLAIFQVRGFSDLGLYAAILLLLIWKERHSNWWLLISGACLGLGVLSYRAYIVWGIVMVIFIAYQLFEDKKISLQRNIISVIMFSSGLGIAMLGPVLYFVVITDWRWMSDVYLANGLVYGLIGALTGGVIASIIFSKIRDDVSKLTCLAVPIYLALLVLFVYKQQPDIATKIGVIHDFARIGGWLIIPFMSLVVIGGIQLFKKHISIVRPIVYSAALLLAYVIIAGTFHPSRGPSLAFTAQGSWYFISLIIAIIIAAIVFWKKHKRLTLDITVWQYGVLILPVTVMFAASLTYSDWLPTYAYNYAFSFVLGGAVIYAALWKNRTQYSKQLLALAAIFLTCSFIIFPKVTKNAKRFNPSTEMEVRHAWNVVEYIQAHTNPTDEIFTAVPFFALRSGRPLALNITHPVVYIPEANDPKSYDPYNVIPSISEIQEYLSDEKIEYIIQDERTRSLFRTSRHARIQKYIKNNYSLVEEYGNIKILRHNSFLTKRSKAKSKDNGNN